MRGERLLWHYHPRQDLSRDYFPLLEGYYASKLPTIENNCFICIGCLCHCVHIGGLCHRPKASKVWLPYFDDFPREKVFRTVAAHFCHTLAPHSERFLGVWQKVWRHRPKKNHRPATVKDGLIECLRKRRFRFFVGKSGRIILKEKNIRRISANHNSAQQILSVNAAEFVEQNKFKMGDYSVPWVIMADLTEFICPQAGGHRGGRVMLPSYRRAHPDHVDIDLYQQQSLRW